MSGQLLEAQNRLKANLDSALENCNAVLTECGSSADLPPIGTDSVCCLYYCTSGYSKCAFNII